MFNETTTSNYNRELVKDILKNKNYRKAQSLCAKYSMEKFDDFAKANLDEIRELQKQFE